MLKTCYLMQITNFSSSFTKLLSVKLSALIVKVLPWIQVTQKYSFYYSAQLKRTVYLVERIRGSSILLRITGKGTTQLNLKLLKNPSTQSLRLIQARFPESFKFARFISESTLTIKRSFSSTTPLRNKRVNLNFSKTISALIYFHTNILLRSNI